MARKQHTQPQFWELRRIPLNFKTFQAGNTQRCATWNITEQRRTHDRFSVMWWVTATSQSSAHVSTSAPKAVSPIGYTSNPRLTGAMKVSEPPAGHVRSCTELTFDPRCESAVANRIHKKYLFWLMLTTRAFRINRDQP